MTLLERFGLEGSEKNAQGLQSPYLIDPLAYAQHERAHGRGQRVRLFEGSYQSNYGNRLTRNLDAIAMAYLQELGIVNIAQMSPKQAAAIFDIHEMIVRDCHAKYTAVKGRKYPVVYNASKGTLERGGHWNNGGIASRITWMRDDLFRFRIDRTDYVVNTDGVVFRTPVK
jgi:hypothetical protein